MPFTPDGGNAGLPFLSCLAPLGVSGKVNMKDQNKTKRQLLSELATLRQEAATLTDCEAKCGQMEEALRESKRAEEMLKEESWRLESILQSTNLGSWEWNVQTGETVFNKRWAEIIGYTLDEISPASIETWTKFAHPDDLKGSNKQLEKHFRGESEYYEFESRMKHKDGHWVWVLDRGKVFSWTRDGKPLMMFGTHTDITKRKLAEDALQHAHHSLQEAYDRTIEGWVHALDLRDKETEGHTQRVTSLTIKVAHALGFSEEEVVHMQRGVLLHDMGKLVIKDEILQKAGPLTEAEWVEMRKHPVYTYEMLSPIAYLQPALDIPYCHHERWDGSGYPRGLKGEEIPIAARLFSIIDVWDALGSDRPYRSHSSHEEVAAYLRKEAGRLFDPHLVELFLSVVKE